MGGQLASELALQAERHAAEAQDTLKQLAAARAKASELEAESKAALRKVRLLQEEMRAMHAAADAAKERYSLLMRQHELLIESEHSLRLQVQLGQDAKAAEAVVQLATSGSASLSAQLQSLEQLSSSRTSQLDAADRTCAALSALSRPSPT